MSLLEIVNKQFQWWITYKIYLLESSFLPFLELILPAWREQSCVVCGGLDKRRTKISLENKDCVQIEKVLTTNVLVFFLWASCMLHNLQTSINFCRCGLCFLAYAIYMYLVKGTCFQILSYGRKQTFGNVEEGEGCSHTMTCPVFHCKWAVIGGLFSFESQRKGDFSFRHTEQNQTFLLLCFPLKKRHTHTLK